MKEQRTMPERIPVEARVTEARAGSTPILRVEEISKSYRGRTVVDRVSFTVGSGEIIGLLGKNGAGKTTTFRMTIGMIPADEGAISFLDQEVTAWPMYKRARLGMGYLSQEPSVFRGLTVEANLKAILETTALRPAEQVRGALGQGSVREMPDTLRRVDVTVVVGADYVPDQELRP